MEQSIVVKSTYSKKEEFWNAMTHGIGAFLTVPATYLLVKKALFNESNVALVSYIIFGISMFLLYLASTLYHSVPTHKNLLKKLDHSSIFLLIAGTYTPVALIAIGGSTGWTLVGIEWGLAVIGVVLKQFFVHRYKKISLLVYIGMGWLVIFVFQPVIDYLTINGVLLLLAGGLSYTVGTYFYKNSKIPYNHAIWHVFVMGGSVFMFLSIYFYC
ncbi:PAQR family membrane homeostasis protein TrhA [Ureibacillus acetophenoni]|uniref:Channel protein (Hemolysin III family) n=1 Tax=Ureibacillus acetophenoni TaxID=614649 RepID=A0A285U7C7_9BACL|nr:hemolysin III family protein [Ureibacillus acetophenoni]SOC36456.1 channel protein (hemolysin III family) [Ureibacillus acetophenoni]